MTAARKRAVPRVAAMLRVAITVEAAEAVATTIVIAPANRAVVTAEGAEAEVTEEAPVGTTDLATTVLVAVAVAENHRTATAMIVVDGIADAELEN